MKILAVDTSTRMGSIALIQGPQLICERELNAEVTHTERLLPAIEALFKEAKWELANLQGLALGIGPGSFTGLRIGLATLKGFAQVYNLPLVGISSLLALAHNERTSKNPVAAILDAKRGEVFAAIYRFQEGSLKEILFEEQAIKPELLCSTLNKIGTCLLVGDGVLAYQKLFQGRIGKMEIQAKWVGWLAFPRLQRGEGKDWSLLTPNYLRLSDAEMKR